jgi:hypothetical protein
MSVRAAVLTLALLLVPALAAGQDATPPSRPTEIHGSVALSWYHFEDLTESDLDFSQPTLRLKLKAKRLWGSAWNLGIKFRSRYNDRSRSLRDDVPETEWRNRVYEGVLSYDNPAAPVNLRVGRIVSNVMSGIGYIDGLLLQHNASAHWRWGVFAGTQPDWETSEFQTSVHKYGVFVKYLKGDFSGNRLEATLAAAGEYHGSDVSREYVYLQSSFQLDRHWGAYGSLELDVNREWRRDLVGEDLSVSGLFLTARYRTAESLSAALSYDSRRTYVTREMRSEADSLFDDAFRQGLRASLDARLPGAWLLGVDLGVRAVESASDETYSYALRARKSGVVIDGLTLDVSLLGFSNPLSSGYSPEIRLGKRLRGGHSLDLSYGNYTYDLDLDESQRVSHRVRVDGQFELLARLYAFASYEYDWGDDVVGHRVLTELGYRF